jgi:hypothetical protein
MSNQLLEFQCICLLAINVLSVEWEMTPRGLRKKWPEVLFCEVKQRLIGDFLAASHELWNCTTNKRKPLWMKTKTSIASMT